MSKDLKKKVIHTIAWSTELNGSETWTNRKCENDISEAFEMWTLRNMKKISWKDHKTNEYFLDLLKKIRKLLNTVLERKNL